MIGITICIIFGHRVDFLIDVIHISKSLNKPPDTFIACRGAMCSFKEFKQFYTV